MLTKGGEEIFLSYTGGPYKHVALHFSKALTDRLDHAVADWVRAPRTSGVLWDELRAQMEHCRVFVLIVTSDYRDKIAGAELQWLVNRCRSDPTWAASRLIIPVILDPKAEWIWKKYEKQLPPDMQGIVRQTFVNDQGKCDLTTNSDGEMVLDPEHVPAIDRLRNDIRAHLTTPSAQPPKSSEETSKSVLADTGEPKVFVFGGAEWAIADEVAEMRNQLLSEARKGLSKDQKDRLVDVGDEWAEQRFFNKNAPVFAGGGNAHAILVGDREVLNLFAEEDADVDTVYSAFLKAKIRENLSALRGWQVKEHSLWLPEAISPTASDLDSTADLGDFLIESSSVDQMAAKIKGLLVGGTSASILYQNPGQQFEDIAIWARTRFAEEFQLIHAQVDTFRDHDVLQKQISGILNDGDESIILIAGDGAIDASNRGRRDTHNMFQDRLSTVEIALRNAMRDAGIDDASGSRPKFGRIFLQYRNPAHIFGELIPKASDPEATWVPVRFNAGQPCDDCMATVREVIDRVCG